MGKIYPTLLAVLLVGALADHAQAVEPRIGVGYQGMYVGNFLQGVSGRAWFDRIGVEANLQQTKVDYQAYDYDLFLLTGKVLYSPIVKDNSQFYVGLEGGFGELDSSEDMDITVFGPLFGAEYRFDELPELGFCWEVGYRFTSLDGDDGDDADMDGISISLGLHYYFN